MKTAAEPSTMKFWLVLSLSAVTSAFYLAEQDEFHFKSWMAQHNKFYNMKEYYQRLQIFTQHKKRVDKHNEGNHSFTMSLNQFSDMTFSEFQQSFLWSVPQNCSATKGTYRGSNGPHPDSIDWRKKGNYVTAVKNQVKFDTSSLKYLFYGAQRAWFRASVMGACGSCWTFSTTGCLESVTAIATGKLVPLSEQQLVDCAQDFNNHGCNGGLPSQAFEYIMYNKGLMTEQDYPYTSVEDTCVYKPSLAAAFVKDVVNITQYDEMGMVDAVATRNPVSLAFQVTSDFMHYSQGVYTSKVCHNTTDEVNHAVLAVGYGEEHGTPYWIVKNSWGPDWGMDGYFLIERGRNMCGLAACSSFPVV